MTAKSVQTPPLPGSGDDGGPQIRLMKPHDLAFGLSLSREAGWNQTITDWQRLFQMQPQGCLVAVLNGRAVGTAIGIRFAEVAWIAMVLVQPEVRGRGVGRALLQNLLRRMDHWNLPTVRLDATEQGQRLYSKLGFTDDYTVLRLAGTPISRSCVDTELAVPTSDDLDEIVALDTHASGTCRRSFLLALFKESGSQWRMLRRGASLLGYLGVRPGQHALQLGPCIASDTQSGTRLLQDALQRFQGCEVFIDVPADHTQALALAHVAGLVERRRFTRMTRGRKLDESPESLWASSGPELG